MCVCRTYICFALGSIAVFSLSRPAVASEPPPVTNDAPAAGKRVRVTNAHYAGTNVHHTLYLPTDWVPGGKYPVIIEYAPNGWAPNPAETVNGSVEDTKLGFYQSGGQGFIWATMPFIDTAPPPARNTPNWWWGTHPAGVKGEDVAADYTKAGLIDILENYGGDPASVFVTGFSRGAIAAGQVGLRDQLVDSWLGFLPHSHHYQLSSLNSPNSYPLLDSIAGRASFITAGDSAQDGGYGSSIVGRNLLTTLGMPVEFRELNGENHTFNWIEDDASATSLAVRAEMRTWLANTIANRPGTSQVTGKVTEAGGNPISGVRIQSGDTHWTYSDQNGFYALPSLINGNRTLTASHPNFAFINPSRPITIAGANLTNQTFMAAPSSGAVTFQKDSADFTYQYNGNTTPTAVGGWGNTGYAGAITNLALHSDGNVLDIAYSGTPPADSALNMQSSVWNSEINDSTGWTLELSVRLKTQAEFNGNGFNRLLLRVGEPGAATAVQIQIDDDGDLNNSGLSIPSTTDGQHVFRVAQNATFDQTHLWVDGQLLSTNLATVPANPAHMWGDLIGFRVAWEIDYIRFTKGGFAPVELATLPGDFNSDGTVDTADYIVWRNGNGSQQDYQSWRANFGRTTGDGNVVGGASAPEPSAGLLLVLGLCGQMYFFERGIWQ